MDKTKSKKNPENKPDPVKYTAYCFTCKEKRDILPGYDIKTFIKRNGTSVNIVCGKCKECKSRICSIIKKIYTHSLCSK